MNNEIMDILNKLDRGSISSKKALKLINKIDFDKRTLRKKSSKLKITIVDGDEGKKLRLPAMPFWFVKGLANMGLGVAKFIAKRSNYKDKESLKYLDMAKEFDLSGIFNELKNCEPCDIVDVIDGSNGDKVKISIL